MSNLLSRLPLALSALALPALALTAPPASAGTPAVRDVVEDPHLVVLVRTTDPESRRWYRDAYPALLDAGWRIQVYQVPAIPQLGELSGPMFSLKGDAWHGYHDRASHFRRLARATAPEPADTDPPTAE